MINNENPLKEIVLLVRYKIWLLRATTKRQKNILAMCFSVFAQYGQCYYKHSQLFTRCGSCIKQTLSFSLQIPRSMITSDSKLDWFHSLPQTKTFPVISSDTTVNRRALHTRACSDNKIVPFLPGFPPVTRNCITV